MKKNRKSLWKKTALLLSAALLAGMAAGNGSDLGRVYAAGGAPSVTGFATKDELKTKFSLDGMRDGVEDTVGRLRFGKNAYDESQIWYIAGTDSGIKRADGTALDDNIVLFAAEPILGKSETDGTIIEGQKFSVNKFDEPYDYEPVSGCQYSGNPPAQVYSNHYGRSDLRATLRAMAESEDYFTQAEQKLMNATTVETLDTLNNVTYTTTDKLYALSIWDVKECPAIYWENGQAVNEFKEPDKVYAGSGNNIAIASELYSGTTSSGTYWLRSPATNIFGDAYTAPQRQTYYLIAVVSCMSQQLNTESCGSKRAVKPAANLNLTNVLFASAAEAASQEPTARMIADETPMVLRLDGAAYGKTIGTVGYDETEGLIVAQRDAGATGTVSLVVQGNDGTQDWYYSVVVDGSVVVTKEQLQKALNLSAVTLGDCKIWLETTEDNVAYATKLAEPLTQAAAVTKKTVSKVELTGVKPVGGTTLADNATCATAGIAAESLAISYTVENTVPATGIAEWDTVYSASFTLRTGLDGNQAYVFADDVKVTVDGETIGLLNPDQYGRLSGGWAFTTEKRKITGITAPASPNGGVFSNYYTAADVLTNSELGTQAEVTLEGTAEVTAEQRFMDVEWKLENANGAGYGATPGAKNTFRWTVKPDAYQNYDANNNAMTGTYEIANRAATPVSITGTDANVAFTGADIDVSAYFTIDPAAGAATYSLEAGGTGKGALNGSVLTVTQAGTFFIKASTAANGNYAAGEKTITLTVGEGSLVSTATDYSGIYDGQPHSITVSVTEPSGAVVTYSTDGVNFGAENPKFTKAGSYDVAYRIEKENYATVTGTKKVVIEKRGITITAGEQTILWGTAIDQTKYTVSTAAGNELVAGDHIAGIALTPSTSERTENGTITVGSVKIVNAAGEDVTDSYKLSAVQGVLKITHNTTLAPDRIEAVKTRTAYKAGDALNLDDLTVTAYYADGYSEVVTGYTTNASGINMSVQGAKILTVSFTQNGVTKTRDLVLTVDAQPSVQFAVTATAGANGKITPDGTVLLNQGGSQTFTITPDSGYVIDTLTVDGSVVAATTSYTFSGIALNHTISVTFKPEPPVISLQPSDRSVNAGETVVFKTAVMGTNLAYQWQVDRNDKKGWVNISRAESTELKLKSVEQSQDGFRYRCIISNSAGSVTSNEVKLTVVPVNVEYKVSEGADNTFTLDESEELTIRVDAEFGKFLGVEMDGWKVDPANYTSWSGSTYVKFTRDFMNTQVVGNHTVRILFSDGYATTTVTIARNEQQSEETVTPAPTPSEEITVPAGNTDKTTPETGGDSVPKAQGNTALIVGCIILMVICGAALVIFGLNRRSKDK